MKLDLEKALQTTFESKTQVAGDSAPSNLVEAMRYSLLAPGKRIRPRLVLACAEMIGLPQAAALPAGLALEIIHCFTLIHDDLPCMDNDDFRRGRPSNHKVYGEGLALLAGDALMGLGTSVFLDAAAHVPPAHFLQALRRLDWAIGARGVIGGQAAELLLTPQSQLEELQRMHTKKTGALFSAALLIPMDLHGISESTREGQAITRFASELGRAFQVADDFGDAEQDKGKPTNILTFQTREQAQRETVAALDAASAGLETLWREKSLPLRTIADQVRTTLL